MNSSIKTRESIIGTWKLVSFEERQPDGKVVYPMGQDAVGYISYDDKGHMSVQLMKANPQRFAADDPLEGTPEEKKLAFERYLAYWGTYRVHEEEGAVTHHLEGSLFPNWVGTDRKRFFEVSGDQLMLKFPLAGGQGSSLLIWKRLK